MTASDKNMNASKAIIRSHIHTAFTENFIQWNDGLNYTEFIKALWRLFVHHDTFKVGTEELLTNLSEEDAIQLLSDEIDITKLKSP